MHLKEQSYMFFEDLFKIALSPMNNPIISYVFTVVNMMTV